MFSSFGRFFFFWLLIWYHIHTVDVIMQTAPGQLYKERNSFSYLSDSKSFFLPLAWFDLSIINMLLLPLMLCIFKNSKTFWCDDNRTRIIIGRWRSCYIGFRKLQNCCCCHHRLIYREKWSVYSIELVRSLAIVTRFTSSTQFIQHAAWQLVR